MAQKRPPSTNNQWINLLGLGVGLCAATICIKKALPPLSTVIYVIAAYGFAILLLEAVILKTPERKTTSLQSWHTMSFERVFVKLVGLYTTFAVIIFLYWLFPEYRKAIYNPYWSFLYNIGPWIMALSIPYFMLMDAKTNDPYDAYWQIGSIICCYPKRDYQGVTQYCLSWLMKGYFLPFMFTMIIAAINILSKMNFTLLFTNISFSYFAIFVILVGIDSLIATTGYLLTLKMFDSHIRSSDSTLFGWVICLLCYAPFYGVIVSLYFPKVDYYHYPVWTNNQVLQWIWGVCTLLTYGLYVFSTINFGIRFANLTNRGIITNGLYRFFKHPSYTFKIVFFWTSVVPISYVTYSTNEFIKTLFYLTGISLIYYYRAVSEERHLSNDPTYVEYALWMNEHGLIAPLSRRLAFLKFQSPTHVKLNRS
jgi:hypothetical protein